MPRSTKPAALRVVTAQAQKRRFYVNIEGVGTLLANESTEITSKTLSTVEAIRFRDGAVVQKGEILVEFDASHARADLAAAEAALDQSRSQLSRSRELWAAQALSKAELEQLDATYKADLARVAAARARLNDTIVRAPFSGRIGFRRISVGSVISPGGVISTLYDVAAMKLDFTVPQASMFGLRAGQRITAKIAGLPDRTFVGKLSIIDSRIDPVTRTVIVRAELPNPEGLLKPGMFATATVDAFGGEGLSVPEEALVPEQDRTFVFVVRDGRAIRREIATGMRQRGEVQVTKGLALGERIVVEGTQSLRDGAPVCEIGTDERSASAS